VITGLKDFARVGKRLIDRPLADVGDLDQVLLGVQEHDPEQLTIEKAHFGTEIGDCDRTIEHGAKITI
jgi:hypothetical protein